MLNESTLLSYLDETKGWVHGQSKTQITVTVRDPTTAHGWMKMKLPTRAAKNDEKGVYLRWFSCDDDSRNQQLQDRSYNVGGNCPNCKHIHVEIRLRTKAGGMTTNCRSMIIPQNLTEIKNARGAPPNRKRITKDNLPEPFRFNEAEYTRDNWGGWSRVSMLSTCNLVGPVGISSNAKVLTDLALEPGEEVWFHFDCTSPSSATFDIITDGEVFYPLNRRSKRISDNLKPKSTIDLTLLGVIDQAMILKAIEVYASEITNGS